MFYSDKHQYFTSQEFDQSYFSGK